MRVLLSGAGGAMGRVVAEAVRGATATCAASDQISCGYDPGCAGTDDFGFPVVGTLADVLAACPGDRPDVAIDFSVHTAAPGLADWAVAEQIPLVVATTGHTDDELTRLREAARVIPVFYSGNMSLGVYVLRRLTELAAQLLPGADIEIVEAHHRRKVDAPSGTAQMLVDTVRGVRPQARVVPGRTGHTGARQADEIGVHALRGGTIVGEHTVMLACQDEFIELKHTALSRQIFATGAIQAAHFVVHQAAANQPGWYTMDDLLAG